MSSDLLRRVVDKANGILQLGYELEDPDIKESHPGKPLSKHVSECSELSSRICDVFGLDRRFARFSDVICSLHDLGKLHPEWKPGIRKIKHSIEGAEILSKLRGDELGKLTGLSREEQDLLIFMVRKHHSALRLSVKGGFKEYRGINWLESEPGESIGYADSFGAFKLADFASANDMGNAILGMLEREWPSEDSIISLLGKVDLDKLSIQEEISHSQGHVALTAPTGWGKTIIGILSSIASSPVKLFYALPTITAIRKMSDGLKELLEEKSGDGRVVGEYFYFVDVDLFRDVSDVSEEESRLLDFYRLFIPKVNITTVDQILLSLMRAGKYHMRRFELRKSVLVIDEYHLLPAPMIGALAEALGRYASLYGMKVVLMTATPSSAYKEALIDVMGDCKVYDLSREYRKLRRHRMELIGDMEEGLELVRKLTAEGKRVLVILNTVRRAKEFYRELDVGNKVLLHSRFAVKDRYEKEGKIDESQVLVATQVAEVSLDVSFDSLVSDLAPIPSIIQRAGRVNRYGERGVREPNIHIMEKLGSSEPYYDVEVRYSSQVLEDMGSRLGEENEGVYLEMLKEYDELVHDYLLDEVNSSREKLRKSVFEGNQLLALSQNEENLIRDLRGEMNVLAVPSNYEEDVRRLFIRRREASSYEERMMLWAKIKGYLVPVKLWMALKHGRHAEGIPLTVIGEGEGTYDQELGLLIGD